MNGQRKTVYLYTDGACSGNPGPGGWGAVLQYGSARKELSGGEPSTTNNRMELTAAIRGLQALREPCHVVLTSDSRYLVDAVEKGWLASWQRRGWKRGKNEPVLNVDLWQELLPLLQLHDVEFVWVKGHACYPENELCDRMAVAQWEKFKAR